LETLDRDLYIPVIAPLGVDKNGDTYNVNADEAAGAIAAALKAEKLVFLTDVPGLCKKKDDPKTLMPSLKAKDIPKLVKSGVIGGGMIPKTDACLTAVKAGVQKTHIIDGRVPTRYCWRSSRPRGSAPRSSLNQGWGRRPIAPNPPAQNRR
jgi:acetylglutamate kinase